MNILKALIENLITLFRNRVIELSVILLLTTLPSGVFAQAKDSTQTLFKSNFLVSELWTPEIKINSIQGDIGTLVGFYGGALINRQVLIGITCGVNLSHPKVNYGYFGGVVQYIYKSSKLVHCSGQLALAYGSTKDYQQPKSGLLDNFWNISGAGFFLMEPGLNLELNLNRRMTFVAGMSYRYVTGLNENNKNVSITHVTNEQLSGINFNLGLKIGKKPKN